MQKSKFAVEWAFLALKGQVFRIRKTKRLTSPGKYDFVFLICQINSYLSKKLIWQETPIMINNYKDFDFASFEEAFETLVNYVKTQDSDFKEFAIVE